MQFDFRLLSALVCWFLPKTAPRNDPVFRSKRNALSADKLSNGLVAPQQVPEGWPKLFSRSKTCKRVLKVPFLLQNCCHTTWTLESYVLLVEQASLCRKDEFKGLVVIQDALQARSWRILGIGRCVFCLEGFLVDAMSFSRSVPITMSCFKFRYSIWYGKDIHDFSVYLEQIYKSNLISSHLISFWNTNSAGEL